MHIPFNSEKIKDWGHEEGYRLLDTDELADGTHSGYYPELEFTAFSSRGPYKWLKGCYNLLDSSYIYRTKLSRAELQARKAWYINGEELTEEEFKARTAPKNNHE